MMFYQINMINSNRLDYRQRIDEADEKDENPKIEMPQLTRYEEDEEIKTLKRTIESGKASKAFLEKYMVQKGSNPTSRGAFAFDITYLCTNGPFKDHKRSLSAGQSISGSLNWLAEIDGPEANTKTDSKTSRS